MTVAGMQAFEEATGQSGLVEQAKSKWLFDMRTYYSSKADALQAWLDTPGVKND